jgi:hypothetical protein
LYYSIRPMLAVSGGRLVCLSTPFGKRGFFHHEWTEGQEWEKIKITANQCPRISATFLAEEKASMPANWYASEYLCEFTDMDDAVFAYDDIMGALSTDIQPLFGPEHEAEYTNGADVLPLVR